MTAAGRKPDFDSMRLVEVFLGMECDFVATMQNISLGARDLNA